MKNYIFLSFLLIFGASACSVPNLFGNRDNEGSIENLSCSNNDFGPTPYSQSSSKKLHLHSIKSSSASSIKRDTKLFSLIDLNCVSKKGLTSQFKSLGRVEIERSKISSASKMKIPFSIESLNLASDVSVHSLENIAQKDSCIKYIEEDIQLDLYATPNDPQFSQSRHLTALSMPEAWDFFYHPTQGINQTVVVAVIDSGGDVDHPDLDANKWVNTDEVAGNLTDDDGNGYVDDVNGYNFVSNIGDPNPQAGNKHGTFVTGIIASRHNNSVGTAGMMGQYIQIMHLNASGATASVSNSAANQAIIYAVNNDADVINMSFGAPQDSPVMRTNVENAVAAGVFLVAAVGNAGELLTSSNLAVPASYAAAIDGFISVGAILSDDDSYAFFSNYSSYYVEIMAPGGENLSSGIYTTTPGSDPINSYERTFGTSMAAPVVSGAAALAIAYLKSRGTSYTPAQIEDLLKNSSVTSTNLSGKVQNCRALDVIELSQSLQ
ncbi:MAG: S8 family serine peptidase [Bdellovibrionales bacterium]|nr:S8 family serine peptidase [Bdellovibrionales bacterium]